MVMNTAEVLTIAYYLLGHLVGLGVKICGKLFLRPHKTNAGYFAHYGFMFMSFLFCHFWEIYPLQRFWDLFCVYCANSCGFVGLKQNYY